MNAISPVEGGEGTQIKQIFHPHNTMLGIRFSMARCTMQKNTKSKKHTLKSAEVYYITSGTGILHVDDKACELKAGHAVYVPPHSEQFVENTGDVPLEFLCIVDPAWRQEDETITE
ncbi:MAG: cupin domain-containing protein [Thermoproteota archaeon]|nr:cupin domain-containing protein [Candidatus Nitrosotenuis sp.]